MIRSAQLKRFQIGLSIVELLVALALGLLLMTGVIQCLADHRIRVTDFQTVVPTLENVFLKLTGHTIRE